MCSTVINFVQWKKKLDEQIDKIKLLYSCTYAVCKVIAAYSLTRTKGFHYIIINWMYSIYTIEVKNFVAFDYWNQRWYKYISTTEFYICLRILVRYYQQGV